MLFSSTHVESTTDTTKKDISPILTERVLSDDVEQASVEVIFKDWVKRALADLPSLLDIPQGGKEIDYYSQGRKLTTQEIERLWLPLTFNISPKTITKPVTHIIISLWHRVFLITPKVGSFTDISMTEDALYIQNMWITFTYGKEEKLPELLLKLHHSPDGEGEKPWFKWVTVKQVIKRK